MKKLFLLLTYLAFIFVIDSWAEGVSPSGSLNSVRWGLSTVLLENGNVLATGGLDSSAEVFDVEAESWSQVSSMTTGRRHHASVLLGNGKVLVIGGQSVDPDAPGVFSSCELYDPNLDAWSAAASLATARAEFQTTVLPSGKILVSGGNDENGEASNTAEIYDPELNEWSSAGTMSIFRWRHSQTLLDNGEVLVAGGYTAKFPTPKEISTNLVDVYNPTTNEWRSVTPMNERRWSHVAAKLDNGHVLVVSGASSSPTGLTNTATSEIYDPVGDSWSYAESLEAPVASARAAVLSNGEVILAGGFDRATNFAPISDVQIYNPASASWRTAGQLSDAKSQHALSVLSDDRILISGGFGNAGAVNSSDIFDLNFQPEDDICFPVKLKSGNASLVCL